MDDRIKQILGYLDEEGDNFNKAKKELNKEIEQLGIFEQSIEYQKRV